jgi:protein transport protein SEC13
MEEEEDSQWKEEQKLEAYRDWVWDVAWDPYIYLPISIITTCSQDGWVFIWTCGNALSSKWWLELLCKLNNVMLYTAGISQLTLWLTQTR